MLYLGWYFNTHRLFFDEISTVSLAQRCVVVTACYILRVKAKVFGMLGVTTKVRGMVRVPEKDVIKLPSRHLAVKRT